MKHGIIILCRYSSKRLPGKILMEINGKTILGHIYERVKRSKKASAIVVATSEDPSDDPVYDFCNKEHIKVFRGSLEDVSSRFLRCATHFEMDTATRINGDNLFADPLLIDKSISLLEAQDCDFVSNVWKRTFPTGMSVETIRTSFYSHIINKFNTQDYKEHVTLYFYDHYESINCKFFTNKSVPFARGLKLAIDTKEDFNLAKGLINKLDKPFNEYSWHDIVKLLENETMER